MTNWFSRSNTASNAIVKRPAISMQWASKLSLPKSAGLLTSAIRWFRDRYIARTSTRRLRLEETVALGQKRFIGVVTVDDRRFLVGGGASELTVLADLGRKETFSSALEAATKAVAAAHLRVQASLEQPVAEEKPEAQVAEPMTTAQEQPARKPRAAKSPATRARKPKTKADLQASIDKTIEAMARATEPAAVRRYTKRLDELCRQMGAEDSKGTPEEIVPEAKPVKAAPKRAKRSQEQLQLELADSAKSVQDSVTLSPELVAMPPKRGVQSVRPKVESSEKCA